MRSLPSLLLRRVHVMSCRLNAASGWLHVLMTALRPCMVACQADNRAAKGLHVRRVFR